MKGDNYIAQRGLGRVFWSCKNGGFSGYGCQGRKSLYMRRLRDVYRIARRGKLWEIARNQINTFYHNQMDLFTGTVVDAGCGKKVWYTVQLDRCKYVGIDRSISDLLKNNQIDARICADVSYLPLRNESANLIVCQDLIEHLPDPARFIGEVCRVLVPGGTFMINTPSLYGGVSPLGKLLPRFLSEFIWKVWKKQKMPDYPFVYKANTKRSLRHLASDNGLVIEKILHINLVPHWFHSFSILATAIWAYGEFVGKIRMEFLKSYMIVVLRKDST